MQQNKIQGFRLRTHSTGQLFDGLKMLSLGVPFTQNQAFSLTLKTGRPEGMFSHKVIRD